MQRTLYLTLTLAVAIGISAVGAQTDGQPNSKVQSMTGVVKTVFASSLTLEIGGKEIKFGVDRSTRVLAKGRGAAFNDLVGHPGGRPLTDFIKAGDQVTVRYRQSGSALTAVEVRVVQK
jgi:hypothetical protein